MAGRSIWKIDVRVVGGAIWKIDLRVAGRSIWKIDVRVVGGAIWKSDVRVAGGAIWQIDVWFKQGLNVGARCPGAFKLAAILPQRLYAYDQGIDGAGNSFLTNPLTGSRLQ